MRAIQTEWDRPDANYLTRIAHLDGTLSGGLNLGYDLTTNTVHGDAAADYLYGGSGMDWFFDMATGPNRDRVFGKRSGEVTALSEKPYALTDIR